MLSLFPSPSVHYGFFHVLNSVLVHLNQNQYLGDQRKYGDFFFCLVVLLSYAAIFLSVCENRKAMLVSGTLDWLVVMAIDSW